MTGGAGRGAVAVGVHWAGDFFRPPVKHVGAAPSDLLVLFLLQNTAAFEVVIILSLSTLVPNPKIMT